LVHARTHETTRAHTWIGSGGRTENISRSERSEVALARHREGDVDRSRRAREIGLTRGWVAL
jgi:hypothetical protein